MCRAGRLLLDNDLSSRLPLTGKWIAHMGVGYDKIDVRACKERGICVSNTPGALDDDRDLPAGIRAVGALRSRAQSAGGELEGIASRRKPSVCGSRDYSTLSRCASSTTAGAGLRLREWCECLTGNLDEMLVQTDVLSVHV
ncbi:hypothetical protein DAEQUDRAFT_732438 [Daedalea quercina L-15889]|uniref:D-isomer specific 2-hydroxyacid dehydrogenase catalytic domain-containing protein n=1 Tax=Daedalea quercina L-15889 TaxID=1314783 RepID=A0A165LLU7_9APHY|nr:hypothetical protein DAEQUDRAFT_732438 [Daedalea quercina L-15889]